MKKTAIFDVDGTLYNQSPVRKRMALKLMSYYLRHLNSLKELYAIYLFRKYREKEKFQMATIEELEDTVAQKLKIPVGRVKSTIETWMFEVPLKLISENKNKDAISFLEAKRKEGFQIVIYSDYPVENKLKCLGVKSDFMFYPSRDTFNGLKPSKDAMKYIISMAEIDVKNSIFVGDRDEKDGEAAKAYNIEYINVNKIVI